MQPEISVDERVEERRLITEILPDGSRHYLSNAGGDVEEEWRKTKPLGQGTFGDVWQEQCVSDPKDASGRLRAIKKISKGHLHIMKRELKALATFSDPASPDYADYRRCFVEFFGWFENEDHIYIATEFVPHLTLHDHITNRPISEPEAASITVQIARALRFMHQAKFVHRDIKPLNILVASPGPLWRVKVADFGIAKNTQGTQLKTLSVGTVMYMAPELIQATNVESKPYTAAVDIWSLGAIAFCACTGRPPFASQYETYDFTRGLIEFPKGALSNCSQALTDFVMATMAISPAERPTADEILSHSWVRPYVTYVDRLFGTVNNEINPLPTPVHSWDGTASNGWSIPTSRDANSNQQKTNKQTYNSNLSDEYFTAQTYAAQRRASGYDRKASFQSLQQELQKLRKQNEDLVRKLAELEQERNRANRSPPISEPSAGWAHGTNPFTSEAECCGSELDWWVTKPKVDGKPTSFARPNNGMRSWQQQQTQSKMEMGYTDATCWRCVCVEPGR